MVYFNFLRDCSGWSLNLVAYRSPDTFSHPHSHSHQRHRLMSSSLFSSLLLSYSITFLSDFPILFGVTEWCVFFSLDMRRRSRRSASLCRVVNNGQHLRPSQPRATLSDSDVIGDYSLMMAPSYQWCEQMVQRNNGPGEDGMWSQLSQLTTCATRRPEDISDGDGEQDKRIQKFERSNY